MNSTHPNGLPLAAPIASCASPYANPIANEVFAVLAAVVIGNRSMAISSVHDTAEESGEMAAYSTARTLQQ